MPDDLLSQGDLSSFALKIAVRRKYMEYVDTCGLYFMFIEGVLAEELSLTGNLVTLTIVLRLDVFTGRQL